MALLSITAFIAVGVIILVVYSALVVSSRQDKLAKRVREENTFKRASYTPSRNHFAMETAEDFTEEKDNLAPDTLDT